jgi:hypothetical protein
VTTYNDVVFFFFFFFFFLLSLAPQPSLGLGLLQKNPAKFLGGFSTIFFLAGQGC